MHVFKDHKFRHISCSSHQIASVGEVVLVQNNGTSCYTLIEVCLIMLHYMCHI